MSATTTTTRAVGRWSVSIVGLALSLAALSLLVCTGGVQATVKPVTAQAAAANAAFLAYAPPPPGPAGALCLVDTGVNVNPDTTPGLVSATALDGGTGADVDPMAHGTVDAVIAGGAGQNMLGAWPALKIVSVRATDIPKPGQAPTFQFDDYVQGINQCTQPVPGMQVLAIDLPLSSIIPPTPDQSEAFGNAVTQAQAKDMTLLAAAGNDPGDIQLPASQPGILAVGAGDAGNAVCSFSATSGLTFYAPGCDLDQIDPADQPVCCDGAGTSQASAFAAAVLVALRSYDPKLTSARSVQLLLSTTKNGHLDAAAAFRAAGLAAIVDAGTAAIPRPTPTAPPAPAAGGVPSPRVKRATWHRGVLQITLTHLPTGTRLHAQITFAHRRCMRLVTTHRRLRARTPRPSRALLRLTRAGASSATVPITVTRPRR